MEHELKIKPEYFKAVSDGRKNFEIRRTDRGYKTGDLLTLKEWTGTEYTGREIHREIRYILSECPEYGLMQGYCILGF